MAAIDHINQNSVDYEIVPEIAPLFKTTESYVVGDHVIYEANWYTFKEAKAAGAWDATKVDGPFKVAYQKADVVDMLKAFPTDTALGSVASFADGANVPIKSLVVNIDLVQSGSGDPSPENVRLMTGWTGCNVVVSPTQDTQDGTTYSISWQTEAGTVYGGTIDVVSGVLIVNRVMATINDLTWSWNNAREIFYAAVEEPGMEKDNVIGTPIMCDSLPYKGTADSVIHAVQAIGESGVASSVNTTHPYIYLRHNDISTQSALKSALGTAQIVYQLATPQTYQLTPVEVKSLLGVNNVFADCGDVTVEYRADTKLYIDKKIQEALML